MRFIFAVIVCFCSTLAFSQEVPWQKVETKEDLHNFRVASEAKQVKQKRTFTDVVEEIRNRPARRIAISYRNGQDWHGLSSNNGSWRGGGYGGWGHGGWGWSGRYASTAGQGWLNGISEVMQAQGQRAESFARAATQSQEANRRRILNDSMYIEQWFERRKMNKEYRAAEQAPPLTAEQTARLAQLDIPDQPAEGSFDRKSGEIQWPDILKSDVYTEHRQTFGDLYQIRYSKDVQTGLGSSNYRWVKKVGDSFGELMVQEMLSHNMSGEEYRYAKKFVESLVYEARSPLE